VTTAPTMPMPQGGGGERTRFPGRKRKAVIAAVVGAVLLVALVAGWLPRHLARVRAARVATTVQAPPRLTVVTATAEGTGRELTLPGALIANQRTLIYARATGYVRAWHVDIGDRVRTGELLADLETPDLDQQLAEARASLAQRQSALAQAGARAQYAHLSATRQDYLVSRNLVAQQDADEANTQATVSDTSVASAEADLRAQRDAVRQIEDLVSFARVTAPFDGTVTQRLTEVGSLVNAGAGPPAQALFEIEATDPLRVFVRVPQTFAPSMRAGEPAAVVVRQYAGRKFAGKVTRTAGALEPTSRTLETEVVVPNGSGALLAGMYCEVTLTVDVSHRVVRVPASAIVFDAAGLHVATVGDDGRVHLLTVQPGRNLGNEVEIVAGLNGGERVLSAPPADVTDGMRVQPVGG
jgi:membrane fusion protein (multidrug efflux system)